MLNRKIFYKTKKVSVFNDFFSVKLNLLIKNYLPIFELTNEKANIKYHFYYLRRDYFTTLRDGIENLNYKLQSLPYNGRLFYCIILKFEHHILWSLNH